MAPKKVIVGIDIGTVSSSIGIWKGNGIKTTTIPSCVAFTDHNEPMIGGKAKDQLDTNVPNTVVDASRLIGERYSDIDAGEDLIRLWPFKVIPCMNDEPRILVRSFYRLKIYSPEEIVCMILMRLKEIAENELGNNEEEVAIDAVISVPCLFNNSQKIATIEAARMAGINVLQLVHETSATAIAYRWLNKLLGKKRQEEHSSGQSRSDEVKKEEEHSSESTSDQELMKEENVLVFDIGGGTLSVAIIKIKEGWEEFEVKAVAGDTRLGGNDMDAALVDYCIAEFENTNDLGYICIEDRNRSRLRSECESSRKALQYPSDHNVTQTEIYLKSFYEDDHLNVTITRDTFEEINKNLFDKCRKAVLQCIQDSHIFQVHQVILVGGCSGIPIIREMLKGLCDGKELWGFEYPTSAVVHGATILAASFNGAAIRLLISDVTPLTLGVECPEGMPMFNFIPRYTKIPSRSIEQSFKTWEDDQGVVKVAVYEGENEGLVNNNLLGHFIFSQIKPAERGEPNPITTVSLAIDYNGILIVSAVAVHKNGSRQLPRPKMFKRRLTSEEVLKLGNDFEQEDEEEEAKRKKQNARQNVLLYVEFMSREVPSEGIDGAFSESQVWRLQKAVAVAKSWLDENELLEVRDSERNLDKLQRTYFHILHEREYTIGKAVFTDGADDYMDELRKTYSLILRDREYTAGKRKEVLIEVGTSHHMDED